MKKYLFLSLVVAFLPLSLMAQDDMYFVPKKSEKPAQSADAVAKALKPVRPLDMSVDEYNKRYLGSSYVPIDSLGNDVIDFAAGDGTYPKDTVYIYKDRDDRDYYYSARMGMFDGFYGWYDPWFYGYRGLYWGHYYPGYYYPYWYSPWAYGLYDPWMYGYYTYYGWYDPWYYGWYDPWYYRGYGYGGGYFARNSHHNYTVSPSAVSRGSRGHGYATASNGTFGGRRVSSGSFGGGRSMSSASTASRVNSSSNRSVISGRRTFGGNRTSTTYDSGRTYSAPSSAYNNSSSVSYSSSSSYSGSSSGGSFGGGGSRSGGSFSGGGGGRSGGGSFGGRR